MYPRLYFFEPPEQSDPDWRMTVYGEMLPRIQALLANRSAKEIQYAIETLNYLLEQVLPELMRESSNSDEFHIPSPVSYLKSNISKISITSQEEFADAMWSEYFASMALALAGRSFETTSLLPNKNGVYDVFDPPKLILAAEPAALTMEALNIAESTVDFDEAVDTEVKQRIQLQNRAAIIQRYKRKHELWDELRVFFQNRKSRNKSQAIRVWFRNLSDDDKRHVSATPDNEEQVVRTLRPKLKEH